MVVCCNTQMQFDLAILIYHTSICRYIRDANIIRVERLAAIWINVKKRGDQSVPPEHSIIMRTLPTDYRHFRPTANACTAECVHLPRDQLNIRD